MRNIFRLITRDLGPGRLEQRLSLIGLLGLLLGLANCGGTVNNPFPSIATLNPNHATAGDPQFTLDIFGRGFSPTSVIQFGNTPESTLFLSETHIQTTVAPGVVASPGIVQVTVFNPSPGGGLSNEVDFTVKQPASLVPSVTSLSPAGALSGGLSFTLNVFGTNFVSGSTVVWNQGNRPTTFISPSQLQAQISSGDISAGAIIQVGVLNPPPGGGSSNTKPFLISNVLPSGITLSPSSLTATTASGTASTLTVNGAGFNGTSVVNYNGAARATTFSSSGSLSITINPADLLAAGVVPVTVTNPAPGGGTSPPAFFSIDGGTAGVGLPQLIDIATNGAFPPAGVGAAANPGPVVSTDAQFIAFASDGTILDSTVTNNQPNVFLHNSCNLQSNCAQTTLLVSIGPNNVQPNAPSGEPGMSPDGRFVSFTSAATNLGITNAGTRQVYLRDTCVNLIAGCTIATSLVSVSSDGTTPGNGDSFASTISNGGRFVAFVSTATNLIAGTTTSGQQVFLRDTCSGVATCTSKTFLLSTPDTSTSATTPGNGPSGQPAMSPDARFIAFASTATNFGFTTGGAQEIFVRDQCTGVSSGCTPSVHLVSLATDNTSPANGTSSQPKVSQDGRFVVYSSTGSNLVNGVTNGFSQIFLRDTCTGATGCTAGTQLISISTTSSAPAAASSLPSISQTGRFVAFASAAASLVTGDTNGFNDIFVRDTCFGATGCTAKTVRISLPAGGTPEANGDSGSPAISLDGHSCAFLSNATNLVTGVSITAVHVYLAGTSF